MQIRERSSLLTRSKLLGSASGTLKIVSWTNELLSEVPVPSGEPISCACAVASSVWLGVGHAIYRVSYEGGSASFNAVSMQAHKDFVRHIVCAGRGEVWSCTSHGEMVVWDSFTGRRKQAFLLGDLVRPHCMRCVELHGAPTVWVGCVDEIRVFDCASRSLRGVVALPMSGDVTCMADVGIDVVWATTRHQRDDTGSLFVWSFIGAQ